MTAHSERFAEFAGPCLLDEHGETVIYTPLNGTPRNVKAIVKRDPPEPLPGVPNTQGKFILVSCMDRSLADLATPEMDDGLGGIGADEVNTGGDTITVADRIGATATARPVKRIAIQAGGMMTLEVR